MLPMLEFCNITNTKHIYKVANTNKNNIVSMIYIGSTYLKIDM